eukprot:502291_1
MFIANLIHSLFSIDGHQTEHRKMHAKQYNHWIIAISCLLLFFPSITIWLLLKHLRHCYVYEMYFYLLIAINSILGDYIFGGSNDGISPYIQLVDRWTATIGAIAHFVKLFYVVYEENIKSRLCIIMFAAFYCLKCSKNAKTKYSFRMWHFTWHALCAFGSSYAVYHESLSNT